MPTQFDLGLRLRPFLRNELAPPIDQLVSPNLDLDLRAVPAVKAHYPPLAYGEAVRASRQTALPPRDLVHRPKSAQCLEAHQLRLPAARTRCRLLPPTRCRLLPPTRCRPVSTRCQPGPVPTSAGPM